MGENLAKPSLHAAEELTGFVLGLTWNRTEGATVSAETHRRPKLTRILCAFGKMYFGVDRPFLGIQVNRASRKCAAHAFRHDMGRGMGLQGTLGEGGWDLEGGCGSVLCDQNYMAALHYDGHNLGTNHIIGLGNYAAGGLYIYQQGIVNLRNSMREMCGCVPHMSMAFTGTRYTVIWFLPDFWAKSHEQCLVHLQHLGFVTPIDSTDARYLVRSLPKLDACNWGEGRVRSAHGCGMWQEFIVRTRPGETHECSLPEYAIPGSYGVERVRDHS